MKFRPIARLCYNRLQPTHPIPAIQVPVMPCKTILLVEDDPAIAEPLCYALAREGWRVLWHGTGHAALAALANETCDFMILDVGLPDMDGFDLCRQIRQQHATPLLFLTARNDEIERIIGLELGADDYCGKPFSPRELISRIKAIWRRSERLPEATADTPSAHHSGDLAWGPWHLQAATHTVHYHQQALNLTRYEWRLLHTLLKQPERIFSRDELMQAAWDYPDHSLARTVDSHIKTLRQKLKAVHPDDPIITQRGLGYGLKR